MSQLLPADFPIFIPAGNVAPEGWGHVDLEVTDDDGLDVCGECVDGSSDEEFIGHCHVINVENQNSMCHMCSSRGFWNPKSARFAQGKPKC